MNILSVNELYKLSLGELRDVTLQQIKIANENIKQLEESGYADLSQAYQQLARKQGRDKPSFSTNVEGLNKAQLVSKYVGSSSYNSLKTSNVYGTKETNIDIYVNMGYTREQAKQIVENMSKGNYSTETTKGIDIRKFWKNYRELEQTGMVGSYGSTFIQSKLKIYMDQTQNDTISEFQEWLDKELEREQEQENIDEEEENERLWGEDIEDEF